MIFDHFVMVVQSREGSLWHFSYPLVSNMASQDPNEMGIEEKSSKWGDFPADTAEGADL